VNEVLDAFGEPGVATAGRAVDQLTHRDGRGELTLSGIFLFDPARLRG
jgi:hypothetical protein